MSLESEVLAVRDLPAGEFVGYGGRFVTDAPFRIEMVAVGYADGYLRGIAEHAGHGRQHRSRIVGRASMNMMSVDLSTSLPRGSEAASSCWASRYR
ncbi:alanine racemase C-terminal domain-containing protein [Variovorax sp. RA8]|uniref:alanine racemase C-terminal domain-containing protein n=1 Tax=Variovorax sp. (strain JCM 16519 / RA8) TaxID=662548 RepID=UPI000ABE6A21|nr:alanine racemase C-terminal domain-containing protein [Variovorax sp. RA8]VTU35250.1 Alanine racemase [Variovorax sp. RA8]